MDQLSASGQDNETVVALAHDVRWSVPFRGYTVLLSPSGMIGRVPSRAALLLPTLARGATRSELLAAAHGNGLMSADLADNVDRFIASLGRNGFLRCAADARQESRRSRLPRRWPGAGKAVERLLAKAGLLRNRIAGLVFAGAALALVVHAVAVAPWTTELSMPVVLSQFRFEAFLLVAAIWIPAHELAHVVAAVGQGIPVRGIVIAATVRPTPRVRLAVDVTDVLLFPSRLGRFFVYAAGNAVDALLFSVATLTAVHADLGYLRDLSASCAWLGMLVVLTNASPARRSDLSQGLANLLDDPLALGLNKDEALRFGVVHRWHMATFLAVIGAIIALQLNACTAFII